MLNALLIICGVILALTVVIFACTEASGWKSLERYFSSTNGIKPIFQTHMRSARIGGIAYKACVSFGADDKHLFLGICPPFSFSHQPLSIPLTEVETQQVKGLLGSTEILNINGFKIIPPATVIAAILERKNS